MSGFRLRYLIIAGALAMLASPAAGQTLAPGGTFFDDDGNFHEPAIEGIFAAGITIGCNPAGDLYCPGKPMTRAEMAVFLIRALDEEGNLPSFQGSFPDVPVGQWYTGQVERLAQLGITTGYPDGSYRPGGLVSRAEMAAFLIRALGEDDNLPSFQGRFSDVGSGFWFTGYVERLAQLDITQGCTSSTFCPFHPVLRDQMASFVTRAFDLPLITPPPRTIRLAVQLVSSDFDQPVLVVSPPGDPRLFVVDQPGRIWIVEGGNKLGSPFLDIRDLVAFGGEQGLLGLAFHPGYSSNGRFYVNYTNKAGDTRVVEYQASNNPNLAATGSARQVLAIDQPASNHNGGWIDFGPDGYLYISTGDGGGGGDTYNTGQNINSLLAKILRIDVDGGDPYGVPGDNPFVGGSGVDEAWIYGLRNPWRAAFDGNNLYIADVGQGSWEEVSVVNTSSGGANLGWSIMEGAHCFGASSCNQSGLTLPVYEYSHADGCSITGGYVYRGSAIPEIAGLYFFGDYCRGWVRSFRFTGSGITDLRDWSDQLGDVGRITSFGVDDAGELYITSADGRVLRIVRG